MTATDESERRLAEALQARARGGGGAAVNAGAGVPERRSPVRARAGITTALLLALLGGAVLGTALALVSLLAPGVLPPLG